MHFVASGGELKMDRLPVQPFYGNACEIDRKVHILTLYQQPKKRYHLIEKLASLMRHKFAIPKQYWRLAADAVFKHECIDEKQLPKARRPIPAAEQAELKALAEKHEDEFEALDAEVQVEPYFECKCDAPKVDQHVQTEAEPEPEAEAEAELKKDASVQTMGTIQPEMLPGLKCKNRMLLAEDEQQVSGKVLVSKTKEVNRANWQFPNFIRKAYSMEDSVNFMQRMGVEVPKRIATDKDYKQLMANVKQHLAKRDADRADADMFLHLMRGGEPSSENQGSSM